MARGKRWVGGLAFACLLAGSCGPSHAPVTRRSNSPPSKEPKIALSILANSVYIIDPSTGTMKVLAQGLTDFQAGFASWSPDRRWIAYSDSAILVVDPSTGSGRVLASGPSLSMPTWSPDGTKIAYGDGRDLWVTPADSLYATYLRIPLSLAPLEMDWGPTGRIAFEGLALVCHIPFGCSSTSRSDIWTVLPDGTGLRRLTRFGDAEAPKWSRDGATMLFVRRLGAKKRELWVMRQDGSNARRLAPGENILSADWSPNGRQIAMVCRGRSDQTVQLRISNADGTGAHAVGNEIKGTAATVDW